MPPQRHGNSTPWLSLPDVRPSPLAQVVSSVSVVDRETIEQQLAQDSADLLRYLPGVRMDSDAQRFGAQGFSIRGLGGNRVRVEIDGVPLPDAFSVGAVRFGRPRPDGHGSH
jgi:outer membrane receptor protein involved in Fe transport